MSSHHLISSFATAAVVGMTALAGMSVGGTPVGGGATQPGHELTGPRTACAGVANCRVVATLNVDGALGADQVGWRQVSDATAQVRVHTSDGQLMTASVDVRLWFGGGTWGGAAPVDDRPGAEMLVGSNQGAHTPMYTMLTVRDGKLVVEKSPSPLSPLWQIDAAYADYMGWWRHRLSDGRMAMTQKIAIRSGGTNRFTGHDVTYVWSSGRWVRSSSTPTTYATAKLASTIAGFHVAGLEAFPGV